MSVTITTSDVYEFMGSDYSDVPSSTVETYICLVNKLDTCLDANYPDDECTQKAIKLNAAAHFCAMTSGKIVKSQSAPSGASRSFELITKAEGLKITSFGRMLELLDSSQCFVGLFPSGQFAVSGLGRRC